MSWIKNGTNGHGVTASGTSVTATLSQVPATRSVVFASVCYTGPSSWLYPTDNFGDGGSWVIGDALGTTDKFGNQIGFLIFTKIISGTCTGSTVTAHGSIASQIALNVTCFKPNVADLSKVNFIGMSSPAEISGSGHNSFPTPSPTAFWGAVSNGFAFSGLYHDDTFSSYPSENAWSLVASGVSSSPQQGAIDVQGSTGSEIGSGYASWGPQSSSWIVQSRQFYYELVLIPPVIVTNPTVVGTPQVGVVSTYTAGSADSGIVTDNDWYVAGILVGSSATYTPVAANAGKLLTVRVTWTNADGSTTATSAGKTVLAPYVSISPWFGYLVHQGAI